MEAVELKKHFLGVLKHLQYKGTPRDYMFDKFPKKVFLCVQMTKNTSLGEER